jgi:uncharacterized membrane protein
MATAKPAVYTDLSVAQPNLRKIGPADLREALANGLDDFAAMPTYSIFLAVIYPVIGLILVRLTFGYDMLPLIFPLIAGFALIGPLAAASLYELSRRRERGLSIISWDIIDAFRFSRVGPVAFLGSVLMVIFIGWLITAMLIYRHAFVNWVPHTLQEFVYQVFATSAGWRLIIEGCGAGFLFAVVAFAISAVSFPMLLDRDVSAGQAVLTSIRAVAANPLPMALWGLIVAVGMVIGSLLFLLGLAVVFPVFGHASWHLYRRVVDH